MCETVEQKEKDNIFKSHLPEHLRTRPSALSMSDRKLDQLTGVHSVQVHDVHVHFLFTKIFGKMQLFVFLWSIQTVSLKYHTFCWNWTSSICNVKYNGRFHQKNISGDNFWLECNFLFVNRPFTVSMSGRSNFKLRGERGVRKRWNWRTRLRRVEEEGRKILKLGRSPLWVRQTASP